MKNEFSQPPKNYGGRTISTVAVRCPCGLCAYLRAMQGRRTAPLRPPCTCARPPCQSASTVRPPCATTRDRSIGVCLYRGCSDCKKLVLRPGFRSLAHSAKVLPPGQLIKHDARRTTITFIKRIWLTSSWIFQITTGFAVKFNPCPTVRHTT
uniref:Uncharacterized protein n=1 Tax=Eptatretus burgeri TaxID=7764 RepID=A0A8C4X1B3_EPTBU